MAACGVDAAGMTDDKMSGAAGFVIVLVVVLVLDLGAFGPAPVSLAGAAIDRGMDGT
jgi:hypothetical protein